ncbi:hypothetical protein MG290_07635 [Flavobacterium sp. CBA20B-1]|uniref:hypothetical protein n=1 Tax=unclassified Flavobacterium TaxID=196869 RepID=UPI0022248230|nr:MULTISPECIES: hypothetical protein [unclassified Flavobacterium]WCM40849.1 hypothetical protein MG290_07635 [Flavobacterium sp. CBA20B-1]
MKFILLALFAAISFNLKAQQTNAMPLGGYEEFLDNLFKEVTIPDEMHNANKGFIKISVDSLANAKLLMIKPYQKEFFVELQKFIATSKWTAAVENGITKKSVVQIPLAFKDSSKPQNTKAAPKTSSHEFYSYFAKNINPKIFKQNEIICNAKFSVHKDGSLELISIDENSAVLFDELKRLFAGAEKWNPEIKNGIPVTSINNFKLTIRK